MAYFQNLRVQYVSPDMAVLDAIPGSVLCDSGYDDDYVYRDPWTL